MCLQEVMVVVFIILGLDICVDEYDYYDFWFCVTTSKFKVVTQYSYPRYDVTTQQNAIATKGKYM